MTSDTLYRTTVRRCPFAPVLAHFAAWTPADATRAAWRYCLINRIHGYIIELSETPATETI